ncbi:hypothetical protein GGI13_000273 [Coemansia sp. RSA 455]|nr:hypothetical protein LPJ71_003081 [Coemansia sp. S17]KAJ2031344.1 hypothetical protein H4S03_006668 [Coemansia sp. S3946]KAJ2045745.1 hypothetical protein H4S04_005464 [Coemansia sp. S16]KAJ2056431.1 hypothetical protein GGI08_003870 [Coemansia sp. S2]KAJ2114576.1 hypothetical protein IW146_002983 [Coemansia sp. RSA 922]KAJ2258950.1 hypothetical protein GGI13_000273 [Coemansia sp. RSA 455]KAJ2353747.1 hypothetical protein GGH92_000462 [Coemansia sp. RSA 2673]
MPKVNKPRSANVDKKKKNTRPIAKVPPVSNTEIDDIFATKNQPPPKPTTVAPKSEIDDIFAAKKQPLPKPTTVAQKPETDDIFTAKATKSVTVVDATATTTTTNQQKRPPKSDDFADSRGKGSKYTDDGLRVFYMEDLRIGEGEGETELCPFDCTCCY